LIAVKPSAHVRQIYH